MAALRPGDDLPARKFRGSFRTTRRTLFPLPLSSLPTAAALLHHCSLHHHQPTTSCCCLLVCLGWLHQYPPTNVSAAEQTNNGVVMMLTGRGGSVQTRNKELTVNEGSRRCGSGFTCGRVTTSKANMGLEMVNTPSARSESSQMLHCSLQKPTQSHNCASKLCVSIKRNP